MTWMAGWNMPGYLPETDPVEFDTWEDARSYIAETLEHWEDDNDFLDAHTALHVATPGVGWAAQTRNTILWIEPTP